MSVHPASGRSFIVIVASWLVVTACWSRPPVTGGPASGEANPNAAGSRAAPTPPPQAPWTAPARPAAADPARPALRHRTRPLPEDIVSVRVPSSVQLSPSGRDVAYLVHSAMYDQAASRSENDTTGGWKVTQQLYVTDHRARITRQLTFASTQVHHPRWSPDGAKIAFLRDHRGKPAIHVMSMSGGEARILATGDLEPTTVEWSPRGDALAFTAPAVRSPNERAFEWQTGGARRFEPAPRPTRLFVIPLGGGEPRGLTGRDEHVAEYEWSPDGRRLAVLTAPDADPYRALNHRVARVLAAADGAEVAVLESKPNGFAELRWSPDGRHVAYRVPENTLSLFNVLRVRAVDSPRRSWNAASGLDPTLIGFAWSGDSRSLIAHVYERTRSRLYRLPVRGGKATALEYGDSTLHEGPHRDRAGRHLAFVASTPTAPAAPMVFDVKARTSRRIAELNPQVAEWELAPTEVVRWKSPDGAELEGLLTVTPHARVDAAPPLMVLPHGGPDWVSVESFSRWSQFFAARGYSVFQPNYRGGLGYGYAFYAANRGRMGEIEFTDIEAGVDHLIATGKADPARLVYGGWSWGGYITTWTIGHTRRYRAAVVGAGIVDVIAQYAGSDINHGVAAQWEFKGDPWRQTDRFDRSNPARNLRDVTTPTLILHGREDARVPFLHGIMLYRALVDVGCPVEFYAFPREPHNFREPAHSVHMLYEWAAWYDRIVE